MAPQDYTRRSFQAAAALIAVLVCVAFIPPQTICGIPLRRANILSDVLRFDDKEAADETLPELDDEFSGDFHRFAGQLDAGEAPLPADSIAAEPPAADTLSAAPQLAFEWTPADSEPPTEPPTGDTARLLTTLTPIEDFDTLADGPCTASARDWPTPPAAHPCASPYWATRSSRATSSRPTCANSCNCATAAAAAVSRRCPRP
ncbi:MAG: hypothetical protein ACLRZL_03830 [Alistipes communis]